MEVPCPSGSRDEGWSRNLLLPKELLNNNDYRVIPWEDGTNFVSHLVQIDEVRDKGYRAQTSNVTVID